MPVEKPRIVVSKSERRLEFYSDQTLLRTYKIGLGFSPIADKQREGDGATPEGEFYIFVKNNKSAYYLSLGISYPNAEDAARGLRDGLITKTQHDKIVDVVFVQSGEGTLQLGGVMIDKKGTAATGEFVGSRLEGGSRHPLSTGDVIHIPAAVPHAFLVPKGKHLTYVLVKFPEQ